jgi:ligand-binding sensor domain-containing protein
VRLKIVIILLACSTTYLSNGQSKHYSTPDHTIYITKYDSNPPPLNFRSFGVKDGLPRGPVTAFVQSDDGYVWFSIQKLGLVRFDGYHFKIFKSLAGDTASLPDDYIFGIAKSHKNGLWLASAYGIIWFDLKTYKFKLIPLPPEYLRTGDYGLLEDSRQRLWFYRYAGVSNFFLYDSLHNKFIGKGNHFATDAFTGEKINIDSAYFFNLKESEDGDLFITGKYLLKFNPELVDFTIYKKIKNDYGDNMTLAFDKDKKHIWLSGWNGLIKYNYKNDSLLQYDFEKTGSQKNIESHFLVSPKNNTQLWLPNEQQLRVIDKITGKVFLYKKSNTENLSVTDRNAKGINGTEWFWNYKNGFAALLPAINRFVYHKILPADERVLCQWHDAKNNTIWFGTEDRSQIAHLYKYNNGTNKFICIKIPVRGIAAPRFFIPLPNNTCLVTVTDLLPPNPIGKLFFLNTKTNNLTPVTRAISNHNKFTTDSIRYRNAYPDKSGNYWITTEGQGLISYNIKTQKFFQYISNPKDSTTLSNNTVYSAACGSNNTIWTGSDFEVDSVINKLDVLTGKVKRILLFSKSLVVQPLCEDKKGNVWISTRSGFACYNRYSGEKYLVPEITQLITRAYEDKNGNIIALSADGLWFYDPVKKIARNFNEQDGIKLEYFEDDYISKRICLFNDSVFISDSYRFPISDLYPKKEVPPLHFTSIKIFGKELTSTKNVDALDTLVLQHNENQLSFEFAALSFLSPERNRYACIMQSVDKEWQQLGADNTITYANLAPGNYTFKIKTANLDGIWGKERTLYINIVPAFWQTLWFKILIVLLIAAFFYWLFRNRLKQINLKNQLKNEHLEAQKKQAEFKTRLSEVELSALRSQMNPHFIFNCLNSIKLYTVQNDSLSASEYLTKFSRLIRLVLENSRKEKVDLHSELESLKLYIEMEAMRFKEKLQYSITENIETSYTEIPPLLIQPYVENAIWHGLMHKEAGGNIDIVVDKGDMDDYLKITITDDGIGRVKAATLKSKSAIKQKSYGMRVTSERIALINQLFKTNTTVQILDLVHSDGEAAGTQVIIQIPI